MVTDKREVMPTLENIIRIDADAPFAIFVTDLFVQTVVANVVVEI